MENEQNVTNQNNNIKNAFQAKKRGEKLKGFLKKALIVVLILVVLRFCTAQNFTAQPVQESPYEEVSASYGDIEVRVVGDGVIEANSIYTITPKVTGEILEDYIEVGQEVQKGDLLYVIDSKDISTSINQASISVEQTNNSVNQANIAIEQSNVSLQQSKLNLENLQTQLEDLKIYSPSSGYIENLKIDIGTFVNSMSQVCDVKEKDAFEVKLEFRSSNAGDIKIGQKAQLFYMDHFTYVDGYVTKVADSSSLNEMGAQVTEVTIRVNTSGYSIDKARVEGIILLDSGIEIRSINQAYVSNVSADVIVSNGTGTVKEKYVENGTYVQQGQLIAVLENKNLNTQIESAEMNIKNAQMGIENANVAKRNAENSKKSAVNNLETSKKQLENYNITSPISGIIVYKNSKKGDVISNYQKTNSNIMVTIADISKFKFDVAIDELDIPKIKVGQEVKVIVEALENKEYIGRVSNINTIGINAAGSTNYNVTIEVDGNTEIYSGMTVDAEILVNKKDNTLLVPLTAVRKGDVVYRKAKDPLYQDADTEVPQGYEKVKVEIGLNNEYDVEILSGISEGDIVLADKKRGSGTLNINNLMTMMAEN